ncbi:hypothetical protein X798_06946 [Onchocerca flexuosa]|uniref:Uncharacterized protein n=1 Tax=Onchocerca flexuosa TaxID=387005 RepID=A0A238BLI9_9BILA|nr:hypothetical protein X798_06946 [Onchocerca flexuosa]
MSKQCHSKSAGTMSSEFSITNKYCNPNQANEQYRPEPISTNTIIELFQQLFISQSSRGLVKRERHFSVKIIVSCHRIDFCFELIHPN